MHFTEITALERACFPDAWEERILWSEYENPSAHYITALAGDTVVGYGGVHLVCQEAELERIAVTEQYRGNGIAKGILSALFIFLEAANAECVFLEVRRENIAARRLYEGCGFSEIAVRKNYYGKNEDAIIMKYELKRDGKSK